MWMSWWFWIAGAVVFSILETLAPVFIFLGFSAGALVVGALLAFGVTLNGSLALMVVVFAGVSLATSILLRMILGARRDETKTFVEDVNDG